MWPWHKETDEGKLLYQGVEHKSDTLVLLLGNFRAIYLVPYTSSAR